MSSGHALKYCSRKDAQLLPHWVSSPGLSAGPSAAWQSPGEYSSEFAPLIAKAIADAGGKFLARGGKTVPMHGASPAQRVVIVQFESLEKAEAWANSAASKAAFAIGEKYAKLNDFLVEGVAP